MQQVVAVVTFCCWVTSSGHIDYDRSKIEACVSVKRTLQWINASLNHRRAVLDSHVKPENYRVLLP